MSKMDRDDGEPPLDSFRVRHKSETPGAVIAATGKRLVLHNHEDSCGSADRISDPSVGRLGADIPYRPELKKLCDNCEWPDGAHAAFKRSVEQFRGNE